MKALAASRDVRLDCVLALVMTAIGVSSVFSTDPTVAVDYPPVNAGLVLLALGAGLPVALRRIFPFWALAVSAACIGAIMAVPWNEGVTPLCTLVLLYSIAVYRPTAVAAAGLATVLGMFALFALLGVPHFEDAAAILSTAVFCVPWAIGLAVRRQRILRDEALEQALQVERDAAAAEERAVFNERLRIARELHDVVAHTLSVVAVQAGVARHLMNEQPSLLEPALGAIEDETRKALDDLRRLLGLLRETPDEEVRAGTAPTPGLAELATLIELHRQSYGPVTVDIEPGAQHLDDSACLTVFRIVQEALTNARKHAPMCEVRIRVAARAGDVIVTVENAASGRPAAGRGEGFGLLGMRERVGLFGGVFEAGPTTTGGFSVRAVLPGVAGVGLST